VAGLEAAAGQPSLAAPRARARPGDEVDHRIEGVRAVERRARAPDDLDAVEGVDVDELLRAEEGGVVDRLVEPPPVEQHENPGVEVARLRQAADGEVGVVAVVAREEAAAGREHLGERAVPEAADLVARDHGDRGGRLVEALSVPRRGRDHGLVLLRHRGQAGERGGGDQGRHAKSAGPAILE